MPQRQVSTMTSSNTFIVSRSRANPASRNIKPACMKNTRKAVTSTHNVLMGLTYGGSGGVAGAAAGALVLATALVPATVAAMLVIVVMALVAAMAALVAAGASCATTFPALLFR